MWHNVEKYLPGNRRRFIQIWVNAETDKVERGNWIGYYDIHKGCFVGVISPSGGYPGEGKRELVFATHWADVLESPFPEDNNLNTNA